MRLLIPPELLAEIHNHGEAAYPEEGVGLILGRVTHADRLASAILKLENSRETAARHNRYLLAAEDYLRAEQEAERRGLDVLGIFHSHPEAPNRPSEFDRQWALPWFTYLITSVHAGQAIESRAWQLAEDRSVFIEMPIELITAESQEPGQGM